MRWSLFEEVQEAEVRYVLELARERNFERGEVIFHEGDPADTLHLIERGHVAAFALNRHGQRVMLEVLGPGEAFGELALLGDKAPRGATILALESTATHSIYEGDFRRLRRQHPEVAEVLLALLSEQIRRLNCQLLDALFVPAEARVRKRLVELTERYEPVAGELRIPLRQEDLADLAGTSRATVNRVLRQEAARGTVSLGRGSTTVLDKDRLAQLIW